MKKIGRFFVKTAVVWIIVILMCVIKGSVFCTTFNVMNILLSSSVYGIMICGSIFPLLVGGMDLSVGSVAAFCGTLCVKIMAANGFSTTGVLLGVLTAVASAAAIGFINAFFTEKFNVPALLMTISTQYIFYGFVQLLTSNHTVSAAGNPVFDYLGSGVLFGEIPFPIIIMLFFGFLVYIILNHAVLGQRVYAIGGNRIASGAMGIRTFRVAAFAYIFSAIMAAIGGLVLISENTMVRANTAYGYELYIFIALVVGGVNFAGGEGTIQGALYGALFVGLLDNALTLLGVDSTFQKLITGTIIVIAIAVMTQSTAKGSGLERKSRLALLLERIRIARQAQQEK